MTTPPAGADVRTTPRWRRLPALIGVVGLGLYFGLCVNYALLSMDMRSSVPTFVQSNIEWFWFGNWKMFTGMDRWHVEVQGHALYDDGWQPVDLMALYPSRTESGPRYQRGPFRRRASRVGILASSTCHRLDETPDRVRIDELKWRATLGQLEQPRGHYKFRRLADWDCSWPHPSVPGSVY